MKQIKNWKEEYYQRPIMQAELNLIDNPEIYQNAGY